MVRVEGGSYEWVSRVKKNELGLSYGLTLSYCESEDIEIEIEIMFMRMAVETLQQFRMTGAGLWMLSSTHESSGSRVMCLCIVSQWKV